MQKLIGSKRAGKIVVADDLDTFKKYASDLGLDEKNAELFFMLSESAVLPSVKKKSTLLSLRISKMTTSEALNTIAHELEHAIHRTASPRSIFEKIYVKIRGQKWIDNYIKKYGEEVNMTSLSLQSDLLNRSGLGAASQGYTAYPLNRSGLLAQMNLPDYKSLQECLRKIVKENLTEDKKLNKKILNSLKLLLTDESRAYKAGGAVERYWNTAAGKSNPNATKSEMFAMLYDETVKIIKQERKNMFKEKLKGFFS